MFDAFRKMFGGAKAETDAYSAQEMTIAIAGLLVEAAVADDH